MSDFRLIPSIEQLRQRPAVRALEARFGVEATVSALRAAAADVRGAIAGGDAALSTEPSVIAWMEASAGSRLGDAFPFLGLNSGTTPRLWPRLSALSRSPGTREREPSSIELRQAWRQ